MQSVYATSKYIQPDIKDRGKAAEMYMDRLISLFPYPNDFEVSEIVNNSNFSDDDKRNANSLFYDIRTLLMDKFNYAKNHPDSQLYLYLTETGHKAQLAGGHYAYLQKISDKEFADNKRQERKDKSDEIDFKIKQWTYKWRRMPFIFSGIAFLGTVVSIIISIKALNYKKEQSDLKPLQQEIQELKSRMNEQDSLFLSDSLRRKHI